MAFSRFRFIVWLGFAFAGSAGAATYEVAQLNPVAGDSGNGSTEHPWKTIARAAGQVAPGDVVMIHDGVYREYVDVKTSGTAAAPIVFQAAPGAHVVLTGADELTNWQPGQDGQPIYHVPWPYRFITWSPHMTHPDDNFHRLIGRCEQVMVEDYQLRQVLSASQLAPGAFFADTTNQVIEVWDAAGRNLNKVPVEASVRQEILSVEGGYVAVRGLHFRYAANMAQHGAVVLAGSHDTLEDCTLEDMNSCGASFIADHQTVRRCVFRDNGQLGFGANRAHDLLFTDCLVENNNTKGFNRGWEAGGDKLVLCHNAVLERSRFLRNRGHGIWFDIGNEQCVVRQCLIADNENCGIFDEISYGLQAHDNVITGNGFAMRPGGWGAEAGISLSSSPDSVIERNLIVGNREGFDFREQHRATARIDHNAEDPIWNHDEIIQHNVIAYSQDAQVWGWFDVKDGRQWPAGGQASTGIPANSARPEDIAQPYVATNSAGQPTGLTLEKLRLSFVQNDYFAGPENHWFDWGVTWGKHKYYASLGDFQAGLGIDRDSVTLDPVFANFAALDLRLAPDVMAGLKADYPTGPVPGVMLGVDGD